RMLRCLLYIVLWLQCPPGAHDSGCFCSRNEAIRAKHPNPCGHYSIPYVRRGIPHGDRLAAIVARDRLLGLKLMPLWAAKVPRFTHSAPLTLGSIPTSLRHGLMV